MNGPRSKLYMFLMLCLSLPSYSFKEKVFHCDDLQMLHDVVQGCPSVCLSFDYILPAVIFVERYVDNVDNSILVLKHSNIRWDRMDLYLNISAINTICIICECSGLQRLPHVLCIQQQCNTFVTTFYSINKQSRS